MKALVEASLPLLSKVPALPGYQAKIILQEESGPYSPECQIEAAHDLQAVSCWLKRHTNSLKTLTAYRREAERFLMWCVYERGLPLGKLKAQDFEAYFQFVQAPPASWCTTRANLQKGKQSAVWRPYVAGLKDISLKLAGRVIHSLMNYLVAANYLRANPLKLIATIQGSSIHSEERQYQMWLKMLEEEEWQAVQQELQDLPENTPSEIKNKVRAELLFALFYFLGLRIHEVENARWNAFQYREEQWWFFVKGKGQQYNHLPVHPKLLAFIKVYRLQLGKLPLPEPQEDEAIFISKVTDNSLTIRQLYNVVKKIIKEAAKKFNHDPIKKAKMEKKAPHGIRHKFGTDLDKVKVSPTAIQSLMRHRSRTTTNLYLHAEQAEKVREIAKISMAAHPYNKRQEKPNPQFLFTIQLNGGSFNRLLNLERWVVSVEQNVLVGYQWRWEGVEKGELFEKLKAAVIFPKVVEFKCIIEKLNEIQINVLKSQITLESEMRLFGCQIGIETFGQ